MRPHVFIHLFYFFLIFTLRLNSLFTKPWVWVLVMRLQRYFCFWEKDQRPSLLLVNSTEKCSQQSVSSETRVDKGSRWRCWRAIRPNVYMLSASLWCTFLGVKWLKLWHFFLFHKIIHQIISELWDRLKTVPVIFCRLEDWPNVTTVGLFTQASLTSKNKPSFTSFKERSQ